MSPWTPSRPVRQCCASAEPGDVGHEAVLGVADDRFGEPLLGAEVVAGEPAAGAGRRGSWGSLGGGTGPREVDAGYLRGTWQVDQGHQLVRLAVSTSFGPTYYFDSAPPGLSLLWRGVIVLL